VSLNKVTDDLVLFLILLLIQNAASVELIFDYVSLNLFRLMVLCDRQANLAVKMATAENEFTSVQDHHRLIKIWQGDVILENRLTKRILKKFFLLLAARERSHRIELIGLVHPHVEPHFAVYPSSGNEPLIDKLSFNDCFFRNYRQFPVEDLLHDKSLIIVG
jgi:hypothetical protein